MKPGFYRISESEYHALDALSHSGIVKLLKSPAHYRTTTKPTAAMELGSALHMALLQPLRYQGEYLVKPEGMSYASKEGKAWKAANTHKAVISSEDAEKITGMVSAVRASVTASDLLRDGEAEVSGIWQDPEYGFDCKLRADWLRHTDGAVVDVKTVQDARPDKFKADAYRYGYHAQAAWYLYGISQITRIEHRDFYFVAVEKEPPYGVQVYKADETFIQEGLKDCQRAILLYNECRAKDFWPCYADEVQSLSLPGWVTRKQPIMIMD